MSTMTSTVRRVPAHTREDINRRIQRQIEESVRFHERHPELLASRLRELDEEWDIERAIEANASILAFIGVAAGMASGKRRWLVLPTLVTGFLFQHAIQGWCPPVPILRRLGFRTCHEIERERQALKALRGDFDHLAEAQDKPAAALQALDR